MAEVPNFHDDFNEKALRYREETYRRARERGLDHADADDLAQDYMEELLRKRETLRSHPTPEAFIGAVRTFRIRDFLNGTTSLLHREVSLTTWEQSTSDRSAGLGNAGLPDIPEPLTSVALEAWLLEQREKKEAKRQLRAVAAAVRGFPQRWRCITHGLVRKRSQKDMARELGMSYGALRNAVCEIRKRLRGDSGGHHA